MSNAHWLPLPLLCLIAAGCATTPAENIPRYAWTDDQTAVATLCARAKNVHNLSSECAITLTESYGETVELNGAIVMQPPSALRLRIWKFDQAVFDLTLTPQGLWIESSRGGSGEDAPPPPSFDASKTARALSLLSGDFFCSGGCSVYDTGGASFRVERTIDGQRVVCEIDRATLTPRRYALYDPSGAERFTLTLNRYTVLKGIVFPVSFTAKFDKRVIQIELKDPALNEELNPGAFVPPAKATKVTEPKT